VKAPAEAKSGDSRNGRGMGTGAIFPPVLLPSTFFPPTLVPVKAKPMQAEGEEEEAGKLAATKWANPGQGKSKKDNTGPDGRGTG
jgi:hypothetical protein